MKNVIECAWMWHVIYIWKKRFTVGEPEGKRLLGTPRRRWEHNDYQANVTFQRETLIHGLGLVNLNLGL